MLHHTSAGVWPGFASVSLTAQVIMEVFVLYSTGLYSLYSSLTLVSWSKPHPLPVWLGLSISEWHKACTWPLYCAATVQLYSAVRGLPAGRSTLYRQRLLLWLHTHTLLISCLGPVLSFQIKTLIISIDCVYHLVTIFQIVVQCPGLCCSLIPFIDPGQHSRAPGCRSQSCSVSTRPLVRHHNTICDQWHERDKHQPSHPFLLFNPKIPSELSLIDFLYEKIFCA